MNGNGTAGDTVRGKDRATAQQDGGTAGNTAGDPADDTPDNTVHDAEANVAILP